MVTGTYFNATSNAGLAWFVTSSTVTNGTTFSCEGQNSTNILLIRNIWIPTSGSSGGASTDMKMAVSTQVQPVTSGIVTPLNSFYYLLSGSSLTMQLVNNSGTTLIYFMDGIVYRV